MSLLADRHVQRRRGAARWDREGRWVGGRSWEPSPDGAHGGDRSGAECLTWWASVADLMGAKPRPGKALGSHPGLVGCVVLGESPPVPEPQPSLPTGNGAVMASAQSTGVGAWGGHGAGLVGIVPEPSAAAPPGSAVLSLSLNSTKRVDHSNTRLVTQLDRNPGMYPAPQGTLGRGLLGREPHLLVTPSTYLSILRSRR